MPRASLFMILLATRGFAYSWTTLGPLGLTTDDWCLIPSATYSSLLCADTSVVLLGAAPWEEYSLAGLPCRGACPLDSGAVLLAMGDGGGTDGLYQFDLATHAFDLRYACPSPRFTTHSALWGAYFAGGDTGLVVSANGLDWCALDDLAAGVCRASSGNDSCMVVASDTAVIYADGATLMQFGARIDMGLVEHDAITEASGIAASRRNAGVLWTHNDSGNPAVIYALSDAGAHLGAFTIAGATNRDWEDMAIGYDHEADRYLLYVADFGDNQGAYENKYIYVVEEPVVSTSSPPVSETIYGAARITFRYPDGVRYNAETLLIDPLTNDLFIVTKQGDGTALVFRMAFPHSFTDTVIVEQVADLAGLGGAAVGGDVSPTGCEILIKTYAQILHWARTPATTLWAAFDSPRTALPYVQELQGEAVCWMPDLMGYCTLSEEQGGTPAHLYGYRRQGWHQAQPHPLAVIDLAAGPDGSLMAVGAGTDTGLWQSENHGATWNRILNAGRLTAVAVDSRGIIFAGWYPPGDTIGVALWVPDLGLFTSVNQGLPSLSIRRLRVDPRDSLGAVVACTDSGAAVLTGYFAAMDLRIGCVDPDTVQLEWSPIPAATAYDIYRSPHAFAWGDSLLWRVVAMPETALVAEGTGAPDSAVFFRGRGRLSSYVMPWSVAMGLQNRVLP